MQLGPCTHFDSGERENAQHDGKPECRQAAYHGGSDGRWQIGANNRQQQLERLNERRELYLYFRNAAAAMVEELADGGEPRRRYFNVMR